MGDGRWVWSGHDSPPLVLTTGPQVHMTMEQHGRVIGR